MKKTTVILAHPDLKASNANKIIAEQISKLEHVKLRNIAELYPDFNIDIKAEQKALLESDTIVFQFPFYWYSLTPILKQWMDKVLSYGFAYGSTGDKLKGKNFVCSVTIGGPEESYSANGYNSFEIELLLKPLEQTANLCGMIWHPPIKSYSMIYIEGVYNVLEEVQERAGRHAEQLAQFIRQKDHTGI